MESEPLALVDSISEKSKQDLFVEISSESWFTFQNSFNNTAVDYPKNKTISQLFEENVELYGKHVAVYFQGKQFTYHELNEKANQLAHYLRHCGVGPHTRVALYLERSFELIVAMIAVVKTGAAYVPLDVDQVSNRNLTILQKSDPIKILVNSSIKNTQLFDTVVEKIICVGDILLKEDGIRNIHNLTSLNTQDDLINIMYTSGSTGTPKGCMISQRGVIRTVKNINYIHIQPTDIIAQIANAAFDIMTFEVWGALLNGASLFIIPQPILLSPTDFADTLLQNKISIMVITVSLLNSVVSNRPDAFDGLKYLLFGGEKANTEIIKILLKRKFRYNLEHLNIINAYGPTECTAFATTFHVKSMADIQKNIPIGKPISNTQIYVLDKNMQFVAPGVVGELYLGGDALALGYLNSPEETAACFLQSPWDPKKRIYKTGDLVYWLPDIGVVFIDRVDTQVKIHGFRVEVSEIETCIVKHPGVKEAVVIALKDHKQKNELIAYVNFYYTVDFDEFHQYLKKNLPSYMLPKSIIQIDSIPLTPNGKIDKHRLIKFKEKNILKDNFYRLPANWVEEIVSEVWQKMLGISQVKITRNFFDLGANSLMLSQACTLLNAKLHKEGMNAISIVDILTFPSVYLLSKYIIEREQNKIDLVKAPSKNSRNQRQMLMIKKKFPILSHGN